MVLLQSLLAHSAYFYSHFMSSFVGVIVNKRMFVVMVVVSLS